MLMFSGILFVGIGLALVWFLTSHDRGAKEPDGALWAAFGFGGIAVALTILIQLPLVILEVPGFGEQKEGLPLNVLLGSVLIAATVEEIAKFVPLALYVRHKSYFNEVTDGPIYFALAGLGFGVLENFLYTIRGGDGVGLMRTILVMFLHPATAAIAGFYFSRAKLRRESVARTILAVMAVSLLHAIYNSGIYLSKGFPWAFMATLAISMLLNGGLFWYYLRAGEIDRGLGLSSEGSNRFCRHCGNSNLGRMLYCQRCGQQA
jgi:RsiW-degrading membrane proteinase PrsW (M82 family)